MKGLAVCLSAAFLVCSLGTWEVARAEESRVYFGVFGGLTFLQEFQNIEVPGPVVNQKLDPGAMYGAKLGFIPSRDSTWIGFELEAFGSQAEAANQGALANQDFSMVYTAVNGILRWPSGPIQPYVGAGPSLVWGHGRQQPSSGTKPSFGVNFLAGTRFVLGRRLFLFGEFKHNNALLEFESIKFRNKVNAVVGGVALTF